MTAAVPRLLDWARRLQAVAQTGLAYANVHPYDRERYEDVRRVAAEMLASDGDVDVSETVLALEIGHATPKLDVRGHVWHVWHVWKAVFLCELVDERQRELESETDDARFFARDALPGPELLRFGAATRALLERAFEHREHPEWPAEFD